MSEPSPEAKQAALLEQAEHSRPTPHPIGYHVQLAIDTATAKAREVEVRMTEEMRHMNDLWARLHALLKTGKDSNWDEEPFAKIVKLLDELKQHQTEYDRLSAIIEKDTLRIVELEEQLAHQQPSAATADVEKIAETVWSWHHQDRLTQQDILLALAQVRAPMVGECPICGHKWRQHDPEDGRCDAGPPCECGRNLAYMQRRITELSRAALTGTGEKEDLAGRTGNNKQKGE